MVFSSTVFVFIFIPLVYVLYILVRNNTARNVLLIIVSLFFYAYGEPIAVLLMLCSIAINYVFGFFMGNKRLKKPMLIISVIINIGLLVFFKYLGFLVETFNNITRLSLPVPNIMLPIGISFFTFQILSYVIDAYRDESLVERNILNICLYISFFPQLIAGPIVKFSDVSRQIRSRTHTVEKTVSGIKRFIYGLSKKLIISNTMAVIADNVFALDESSMMLPAAWIGAACYTMQIFFDFSGYSDMAIGLGRMFGFEFKENFNYPFSAAGMTDFWRKWNISVSSWFKEYVYIPLGGNRKGKFRTCINKCIVFFLTGLWHGANMTFIVWGLMHGFFLLLEYYGIIPANRAKGVISKIFLHIYTLIVVLISFVIFRADTISQGMMIISKMFFGSSELNPSVSADVFGAVTPYVLLVFLIGAVISTPIAGKISLRASSKGLSTAVYACSCLGTLALLILCVFNLAVAEYNPFIYFRF